MDRAADRVVQRATRGLIRVDSRRRMRCFLRRVLIVAIVGVVIAGLGYTFRDALPIDLLVDYWDQLKAKVAPVLPD